MTDASHEYATERLLCYQDALEIAQLQWDDDAPAIHASARRIARSMHDSRIVAAFPQVAACTAALIEAPDEKRGAALDALIEALRHVAAMGRAERDVVLLVEGDLDLAEVIRSTMTAPEHELIAASSAAEARERAAQHDVALAILSFALPDEDARELLAHLRGHPSREDMPIIVTAVPDDVQLKTECYALGADLLFETPFDPATLRAAVGATLRRRSSGQTRDPLTGLPHRGVLADAYHRTQAFYDLRRRPLALALLDFDNLHTVNVTHNHTTGDAALRDGARRVAASLRRADLMARVEGDTFGLLLPDTQAADASQLFNQALHALRQEPFTAPNGSTFKFLFSAGLVEVSNAQRSFDEALEDADEQLQAAKAEGRSRVVSPTARPAPVSERILLANDDEVSARLIKDRLEREGYDVTHFTDGRSAYDAAPDLEAALAILDVRMAGLGGFELLERLRSLPFYAHRPIILLATLENEEDIIRGFALGADDYLAKPFSPLELAARVRHYLRKAPAVQASHA